VVMTCCRSCQHHCVYINHQTIIKTYPWVFKDIGFLLLHSGQKVATHDHLQSVSLPNSIHEFSTIAEQAKEAFEQENSEKLVRAINRYQQQLINNNLTAPHSLKHIQALKSQDDILAVKGCGGLRR